MSEVKKVIEKVKAKDILIAFYNSHLEKFLSAWIDIDIHKGRDPGEHVGTRKVLIGPNKFANVDVTVRELMEGIPGKIVGAEERFKAQTRILQAIGRRLRELEGIKEDKQLWQKK